MPIRMTGMISGMDTESLIKGMVDAQRLKNKKTTDKSVLLDFKQERWKELNAKLYKLYQEDLSKLRFQGNYNSKKATSSNEALVGVNALNGAVKGSHVISVEKLASAQILTGGEIKADKDGNPINVTSNTKLKDLGVDVETLINISHKGKNITLEVTEDTKISDFVEQLKSVGLNANFDATQKRFFISSKESGEKNSFEITATKTDATTNKNQILKDLDYNNLSSEDKKTVNNALKTLSSDTSIQDDIDSAINDLKEIAKQKAIKIIEQEVDKEIRDEVTPDAEEEEKEAIRAEVAASFGDIDEEDSEAVEALKNKQDEVIAASEARIKAAVEEKVKQKIEDERLQENNRYITAVNNGESEITAATEAIKDLADIYTINSKEEPDEVNQKLQGLGLDIHAKVKAASDAEYTYNGAELRSSSNETTVNGLTLTLKGETTGDVHISVHDNTQANYDMVKKFVTNYNAILKEMNDLFYAPSAKGYDPLSDEEKEAMTDKQIEKWEDKIKDSILRRDDALGSTLNAMKSAVMSTVEVNGKRYSLSSFGIGTSTDYTEKGLLHINGDADDPLVSDMVNKLMKALEEDPETVTKVLAGVTQKLYTAMDDKMKSIPNVRSKFSFYNDKTMEKQQQDYGKKIKELEKKLIEVENKYYKQFAAMEKAMAQLQSQSNALAGLLGQSSN